jgi:glycosyltransferase involved in cell wall biosynthesis
MNGSSRKILFISHDASRTGAPFVLLHLLKWLKENTDLNFEILLKNGGELESEFEAIAPTYIWYKPANPKNLFEKLLVKYNLSKLSPSRHKQKLANILVQKKFDLIFANSVASCDAIIEVKDYLKLPVICYVHELEMSIVQFCGLDVFDRAANFIDHYIGSSQLSVDNLKQNHGIKDNEIDLVYDYIPAKQYHEEGKKYDKDGLRNKLGIPKNAFVVGSCGTIDSRKGVDLIPQIARLVKEKSNDPIYFIWIGGDQESVEFKKILQDIKKLELNDRVIFVEYSIEYFAAIDVFLLSSREDPFPLVCLQSAAMEKPIICFEKAGGMPEFVQDECGFVVPYLDIGMVAEKIIKLEEDPDLSQKLGISASLKVIKDHDVEIAGKQIMSIIDRVLAEKAE